MSTRGLIGFVHKGQVRASFHQEDSYPGGLGQQLVGLCNIMVDWETFISRYEKINWLEESVEPLPYQTGKEIMIAIMKDEPLTLLDEKDFAEDDIFCEYAYLLNFDTREFEVYSSNYQTQQDQSKSNLSMNLIATYPLDEIPSHWIDFLNMRKREVDIDWKDRLRKQGIEPNDLEL